MVTPPPPASTLQDILQRMDATCRRLEQVVLDEQKAVHLFDTEALIRLTKIRHDCHQELQELETACRDVVRQYDFPDDMSLEAFIDVYLQDAAPGLQALRRKLYQRLAGLNRSNEDNRLRLRAAYDVTSGVLQNIGLLKSKSTYGPGGAL